MLGKYNEHICNMLGHGNGSERVAKVSRSPLMKLASST
jgi:hypothetical protein